jgi:hypothetical protein
MVPGVSELSFIMLMLFGSVGSMPLAGTPQDLDPVLSAVAPEECMWYSAAAGSKDADPNSENQTEQLIAEPEVRQFFAELEEQLLTALRRNVGSGREERVASTEVPKLIKAFLTLPFAMYVEDVQVAEGGVDVRAGLILSAGEQRAELENSINALLALKGDQGPPIKEINENGVTWSSIKVAPPAPEIRWGWQKGYFIVAVGEGTSATILKRMQGSAPDWLNELRNEHAVAREGSIGYLNVEQILKRARPFIEQQGGWQIVEKLGLTSIKSAHGIAGFDEVGCVMQSRLVTDGQRNGLLAFLPHKSLSRRDLHTIPHDAMAAFAVRLDAAEVWEEAVRMIGTFEPRAIEKMDRGLWEAEQALGLNPKDDIVKALGDVWIAYLPAGDLMTSWINSAAAVRVKDADRLKASIDKLVALAQANQPRARRRGVTIRQTEYEGHTIHFVNVVGEPFPFAPAWCVTDEWLVFGLMPQTVRSVLSRELEESLADVVEVRDILSGSDAPSALSYWDTPRLVQSLYPLLQLGGRIVSGELQREGIDVDVSLLPAQETIVKHLRPGVSTMTHTSDGFHFCSRHSLPGSGNAAAFAPIMGASMFLGVREARQSAREMHELNNLKQLSLAYFNYESANGRFPTNVYDENGKALLSWRVQLLPYLEQHAFSEQFHMDEPWDSPHNIKLVRQMPPVFASQSNPELAAAGKTRYLSLAGEETVFPGNKKVRFRDVTDGLSNTILFVRAAPDAAVPWTKPADIEFDPKKPLRGIKSAEGSFLMALCDGSCHRLKMSIDEETLRRLANCHDGEVVDIREEMRRR